MWIAHFLVLRELNRLLWLLTRNRSISVRTAECTATELIRDGYTSHLKWLPWTLNCCRKVLNSWRLTSEQLKKMFEWMLSAGTSDNCCFLFLGRGGLIFFNFQKVVHSKCKWNSTLRCKIQCHFITITSSDSHTLVLLNADLRLV